MSNCAHPILEIVDRVKIVDAKGIREYNNVKCMFCDYEYEESETEDMTPHIETDEEYAKRVASIGNEENA